MEELTIANSTIVMMALTLVFTLISFREDNKLIRLIRNILLIVGFVLSFAELDAYLESTGGLERFTESFEDIENWDIFEDESYSAADDCEPLDSEAGELFERWSNEEDMTSEEMDTLIHAIYENVNTNTSYFLIPNEDFSSYNDSAEEVPGVTYGTFLGELFEMADYALMEGRHYYRIDWDAEDNTLTVKFTEEPLTDSPLNDEEAVNAYYAWVDGSASSQEKKTLVKAIKQDIKLNPYLNVEFKKKAEIEEYNSWEIYPEDYSGYEAMDFFLSVEEALRNDSYWSSSGTTTMFYNIKLDDEEEGLVITEEYQE